MTLTVGSIFGGRSQARQERSLEQHNRPPSLVIIRERPYFEAAADCGAVLEILRETKKDFAAVVD